MHGQSEPKVTASIPANMCRWAEVQLLVSNKSLFYASDAKTKTAKVVKYVTKYGSEVHQVLSDAGLAPILYQVVQLPEGFMQVSLLPSHSVAYFVDLNESCRSHCPVSIALWQCDLRPMASL